MRLGGLDALKAEVALMFGDKTHITESVCELIDNAPTVEIDLVKVAEEHEKIGFKKGFNEGYAQAQVDLERPQGKWEPNSFQFECNLCENLNAYKSNFCPNCGAKMLKGGAV